MTMAPKPVAGPSVRMPLDKISVTAEESGWRPVQPCVVAHFEALFPSSFGQSVLGGVKVQAADTSFSKLCEDGEGRVLLDDGRSTVAALKALKARVDDGSLPLDDLCLHLRDVFNEGLMVTPVYYESGGSLFRVVWNTACHSEENNKYLGSTIVDHIDCVKRVAAALPQESQWVDTQRYFVSLYGEARRRNIHRWIASARALPETVLEWVRARVISKGLEHKILAGYFLDNPYFCGSPGQAHLFLGTDSMLGALAMLAETLDNGTRVSKEDFQSHFCAPVKVAAAWVARAERKYQKWCEGNDAWTKLALGLQRDNTMRREVVRCLQAGVKLEDETKARQSMNNFFLFSNRVRCESLFFNFREFRGPLALFHPCVCVESCFLFFFPSKRCQKAICALPFGNALTACSHFQIRLFTIERQC